MTLIKTLEEALLGSPPSSKTERDPCYEDILAVCKSPLQGARSLQSAEFNSLGKVARVYVPPASAKIWNSSLTAMFPAQHGCLVVNAPTANTVAAAEHGIALICALSRNVAQADASVKAGKWERTKYVGVSIVGKTLAVMGFGKVAVLPKI